MPPKVLHQARVALEFARVLVDLAQADDDLYRWFSVRVAHLLGAGHREDLYGTRIRLAEQADHRLVEIGTWRVRIEDALRSQPDLTEDLWILGLDALARLGSGGQVKQLATR